MLHATVSNPKTQNTTTEKLKKVKKGFSANAWQRTLTCKHATRTAVQDGSLFALVTWESRPGHLHDACRVPRGAPHGAGTCASIKDLRHYRHAALPMQATRNPHRDQATTPNLAATCWITVSTQASTDVTDTKFPPRRRCVKGLRDGSSHFLHFQPQRSGLIC